MNHKIPVQQRWMIRRDMPEVQAIENHCFEFPWSNDDFPRCLRERNCIGMVAELPEVKGEDSGPIVGFMIYELHKTRLHILNFAVHEDYRFKGIGSQMIEHLSRKLTLQRRRCILANVRETNLDAQLFFRKQGFRVVSIARDFFLDTEEDSYLFRFNCGMQGDVAASRSQEVAAS